jgi:parallel beta-helix repeat protein
MHVHRLMAIVRRKLAPFGSLVLCAGILGVGSQAHGASLPVECGSVITRSVTLQSDIGPCPGDGLVVAASGISINLNGYRIFASQRAHVGLRLEEVGTVTVKGGTVDGFDTGVLVVGGLSNTISHMTVQNNRFGIRVENAESSSHRIEKNLATRNRLIGIMVRRFVSGATLSKNTSSQNAGFGIVVDGGSAFNVIAGNEAFENGDVGIELRTKGLSFTRTTISPPVLDLASPDRAPYIDGVDYHVVASSGEVTARLVSINIALSPGATSLENPGPVDTSTSGCAASDYSAAGFQRGDVALVQRGTCTLDAKVERAYDAGASAVILFNEGQANGRTTFDFGAVGEPFAAPLSSLFFPVLSASYAVGFELYNLTRSGPVFIRVRADTADGLNSIEITPETHDNLVTKNSATSASDENFLCGSNQWIKNAFSQVNRSCVAGPVDGEGGGSGLGATSHEY